MNQYFRKEAVFLSLAGFNSFDRYVLPHLPLFAICAAAVLIYAGILYYRAKAAGMGFGFIIVAVILVILANIYH